jgi:hypothetical protein
VTVLDRAWSRVVSRVRRCCASDSFDCLISEYSAPPWYKPGAKGSPQSGSGDRSPDWTSGQRSA